MSGGHDRWREPADPSWAAEPTHEWRPQFPGQRYPGDIGIQHLSPPAPRGRAVVGRAEVQPVSPAPGDPRDDAYPVSPAPDGRRGSHPVSPAPDDRRGSHPTSPAPGDRRGTYPIIAGPGERRGAAYPDGRGRDEPQATPDGRDRRARDDRRADVDARERRAWADRRAGDDLHRRGPAPDPRPGDRHPERGPGRHDQRPEWTVDRDRAAGWHGDRDRPDQRWGRPETGRRMPPPDAVPQRPVSPAPEPGWLPEPDELPYRPHSQTDRHPDAPSRSERRWGTPAADGRPATRGPAERRDQGFEGAPPRERDPRREAAARAETYRDPRPAPERDGGRPPTAEPRRPEPDRRPEPYGDRPVFGPDERRDTRPQGEPARPRPDEWSALERRARTEPAAYRPDERPRPPAVGRPGPDGRPTRPVDERGIAGPRPDGRPRPPADEAASRYDGRRAEPVAPRPDDRYRPEDRPAFRARPDDRQGRPEEWQGRPADSGPARPGDGWRPTAEPTPTRPDDVRNRPAEPTRPDDVRNRPVEPTRPDDRRRPPVESVTRPDERPVTPTSGAPVSGQPAYRDEPVDRDRAARPTAPDAPTSAPPAAGLRMEFRPGPAGTPDPAEGTRAPEVRRADAPPTAPAPAPEVSGRGTGPTGGPAPTAPAQADPSAPDGPRHPTTAGAPSPAAAPAPQVDAWSAGGQRDSASRSPEASRPVDASASTTPSGRRPEEAGTWFGRGRPVTPPADPATPPVEPAAAQRGEPVSAPPAYRPVSAPPAYRPVSAPPAGQVGAAPGRPLDVPIGDRPTSAPPAAPVSAPPTGTVPTRPVSGPPDRPERATSGPSAPPAQPVSGPPAWMSGPPAQPVSGPPAPVSAPPAQPVPAPPAQVSAPPARPVSGPPGAASAPPVSAPPAQAPARPVSAPPAQAPARPVSAPPAQATAPPARPVSAPPAPVSAVPDPTAGTEGERPEPQPVDPEQALAAFRWRLDPETLREQATEPAELRAVRDGLTAKLGSALDNRSRARLLSLRAVASRILGDLDDALADGRLAVTYAEATGELRRTALARARLAQVLRWRGEHAEADRLFAEANSPELPDRLRAALHEHAGRSSYDQGRLMEACLHFERALDLRPGEDPELVARTGVALDAVRERVAAGGFGPWPRSREALLRSTPLPVPTFDEERDLWGYADTDGNLVIDHRYAEVQPFREGMAWVRRPEASRWALIDETGAALIEANNGYRGVRSFSDGLAWVSMDGKGNWMAVDPTNMVKIPPGFEDVRPFRGGLAAVRRDGGWGAVDRSGQLVVPTRYHGFTTALADGRYVDGFTEEGLAGVEVAGRRGVVDRTGRVVVEPAYPALVVHPVAFLVRDGAGRWGALDRRGAPLIDPVHPGHTEVVAELDRLLTDTTPVL